MRDYSEIPLQIDTPVHRELLDDGREVLVSGREGAADAVEYSRPGSVGAGMLCLHFAGSPATEETVLSYCAAHSFGDAAGGASRQQLVRLLDAFEVACQLERGLSLEDLAQNIEAGRGVIAFVNAGELWDSTADWNPADANYAAFVQGIARDAKTSEIAGVFISDPAAHSGRVFIDGERMSEAWLGAGGAQIVTAEPFGL